MQDLYIEGSVFWERFEDPDQYLRTRRQIEQWLYQEFIAKGGAPQQSYPIYMMLGRSKWLLTAVDAATLATTAEIQVPLSLFQECDVSFTYPDSMVSFLVANQKESEYYLPDYHGKLFTLSEIALHCRGKWAAWGEVGDESTQLPGQLHRGSSMEPEATSRIHQAAICMTDGAKLAADKTH